MQRDTTSFKETLTINIRILLVALFYNGIETIFSFWDRGKVMDGGSNTPTQPKPPGEQFVVETTFFPGTEQSWSEYGRPKGEAEALKEARDRNTYVNTSTVARSTVVPASVAEAAAAQPTFDVVVTHPDGTTEITKEGMPRNKAIN